jgi:hypothetical protein
MVMDHKENEGKPDIIREMLNSRLKGNLQCPQYYKENVENWQYKWNIYNNRRDFVISKGIGMGIIKYFSDKNTGRNSFIERFYPSILKGSTDLFKLTEQEKIGVCRRLEIKIKKTIGRWVDLHPRLVPRLPSYTKALLPSFTIYRYIGNSN